MARSWLAGEMALRGLKQADVMRMTHLSKKTVSDAYHGHNVSLETIVRISKALGVPPRMIDPDRARELDGLAM
jgi:transcriptional regulator with XRE-family HTH domain